MLLGLKFCAVPFIGPGVYDLLVPEDWLERVTAELVVLLTVLEIVYLLSAIVRHILHLHKTKSILRFFLFEAPSGFRRTTGQYFWPGLAA